ncbi:MAG: hypothetical protein QI197_07555 [Candidatus Korarchaeota archaeon]|nr:hypothetical protein [Candidatus Korarchaeota archaeon]
MAKYKDVIREVLISLAEGRVDDSLIDRLRSAEEELLTNLPEGLEGRIYLKAAEVIRDLRIEMENALSISKTFKRALYGGIISEEIKRSVHGAEKVEAEEETEEGRVFAPLSDEVERVLVTFKTPVARFVGVDMKVYGPFSEGDIAFIPSENASALKKKGVVEVVEE